MEEKKKIKWKMIQYLTNSVLERKNKKKMKWRKSTKNFPQTEESFPIERIH